MLRVGEESNIGTGGFVCATQGGVAMHSWSLLLPTFGLSFFFLLLSLLLRLLLLTHFGESPKAENLCPPIYNGTIWQPLARAAKFKQK